MPFARLATVLQTQPLPRPSETAWVLTLGCSAIFIADGEYSETEHRDIRESLAAMGADPATIERFMEEARRIWEQGGENFGRTVLEIVQRYAQTAPGPEITQLFRLFIRAVVFDDSYSLDEFRSLFALGESLGLDLPTQMYLLTEFYIGAPSARN